MNMDGRWLVLGILGGCLALVLFFQLLNLAIY
jgi:hypothetical protein